MADEVDPLLELASVLREVGANPRVRRDRIARSTLYDLDYHVALIACVFFVSQDGVVSEPRGLVANWLKLLQFIAVRPALLPNFQIWAAARRFQDLNTWQMMPRGYLGDATHERTVELLVACGVLARTGDELVPGNRFDNLRRIYSELLAKNLLQSERGVLLELSRTKVNKTLLKGQ